MTLWGVTEEYREFAREAAEDHLKTILENTDCIAYQDLLEQMWHDTNSEQFLRLKQLLEDLEQEAKLILRDDLLIKTKMTVLTSRHKSKAINLEQISVFEFERREHKFKEFLVMLKLIEEHT